MKEAREQNELLPDLKLNNGDNNIHFSSSFNYLGLYMTSDVSDELEIKVRIKKATAQMGMLKDFFMCRDVNKWVKYWIYVGEPINMLLWGAKSWSITKKILKKLQSFHHSLIRRILGIEWMRCRNAT